MAIEIICQFNQLKPAKFDCGFGPLAYEEWLRKLENLFESMQWPERLKVCLATYQFEKKAEFWWRMVKPQAEEPPATWNQLKELMDA